MQLVALRASLLLDQNRFDDVRAQVNLDFLLDLILLTRYLAFDANQTAIPISNPSPTIHPNKPSVTGPTRPSAIPP